MGSKKDKLHADFETVEKVPVKKAICEKIIELWNPLFYVQKFLASDNLGGIFL